MKIVIVGMARSGTTALFYKTKNSLNTNIKCLFEPKDYKYLPLKEDILIKILIGGENWKNVDYNQFNNFDKKILIIRDPRDRIISELLYNIRHTKFYNEDKIKDFISALVKKENKSDSLSVLELFKLREKLDGKDSSNNSIKKYITNLITEELKFHKKHPDYFIIKYEDFIDGKLDNLEKYLGFKLKGEAKVEGIYKRVERTKSYGDWKNWFSKEDIAFFKPLFSEYMKKYSYENDWKINKKQIILPKHCSEYAKMIVQEKEEEDRKISLQTQISKLNGIIKTQKEKISEKERLISKSNIFLEKIRKELTKSIEKSKENKKEIKNRIKYQAELERVISNLNRIINLKEFHAKNLQEIINNMEKSLTWKALRKYQKIVDKVIPSGTKIRGIYDSIIKTNQMLINEGFSGIKRTELYNSFYTKRFWKRFANKNKSLDILFVNHEETRTGATKVLFEIAKTTKRQNKIAILSKNEGSMHQDFTKEFGNIIYPERLYAKNSKFDIAREIIIKTNPKIVYVNTILGYEYALEARKLGIPSIIHVHELEPTFREALTQEEIKNFRNSADIFIAVSDVVFDFLIKELECETMKVFLFNDFINSQEIIKKSKEISDEKIKRELDIKNDKKIVLALGYFIERKGADILMESFNIIKNEDKNIKFVWIGNYEHPKSAHLLNIAKKLGENFILLGEKENPLPYLKTANILALPSREDPFPLVALEAMALGKPVILFKEGNGISKIIKKSGRIVKKMNAKSFANSILNSVYDKKFIGECKTFGPLEQKKYDSSIIIPKIEKIIRNIIKDKKIKTPLIKSKNKKISVILPSYNYGWFMPKAIDSVLAQNYTNWELLIIDDHSIDNSKKIIEKYAKKHPDKIKIIEKPKNQKGLQSSYKIALEHATGEYIAFLEADDMLKRDSLKKRAFILDNYSDVNLVYNDIELFGKNKKAIEEKERLILDHHLIPRWLENIPFEAFNYLISKNIVLTLSSAMIRKDFLKKITFTNKYGAWFDWWLYGQLSLHGNFFFLPEKLTRWQIHEKSFNAQYLKKIDMAEKCNQMREDLLKYKENLERTS